MEANRCHFFLSRDSTTSKRYVVVDISVFVSTNERLAGTPFQLSLSARDDATAPPSLSLSVCLESLYANYYHPELAFWMGALKQNQSPSDKAEEQGRVRFANVLAAWKGSLEIGIEITDCSAYLFSDCPQHYRDTSIAKAVLASAVANVIIPPLSESRHIR